MGTIFALSWLITWYGYVLSDFRHVLRLYDFFLASHPLMAIYFAAVVRRIVSLCSLYFSQSISCLSRTSRQCCVLTFSVFVRERRTEVSYKTIFNLTKRPENAMLMPQDAEKAVFTLTNDRKIVNLTFRVNTQFLLVRYHSHISTRSSLVSSIQFDNVFDFRVTGSKGNSKWF